MKNLFDKISAHYNHEMPFVAYRKPNATKVSALFMEDAELNYILNFEEKGFVFAPFNSDEKAIVFLKEKALFVSEEALLDVGSTKDGFFKVDNSSKEKHIKIIEKALEKIKASALQKVVLSREEVLDISHVGLVAIYKKLLATYGNAFVYVWFHPKVGLWLGATPETLLNLEGKLFKTMSLAGTQVCVDTETVVWESKELEEQQLVTSFIENQLEDIAVKLEIDKTETIKAGSLLHLRTQVSGELKMVSNIEKLIRALHPTPAVCGLPREIAREFIFKNEGYNRRFYTGFLGELNFDGPKLGAKSSALFVNLRCMSIQNNKATVYVGGGVTKDSNATKEWEETVSKAKTMKRVL
ncbi:MAG: isochorismate synthase [Arenicella sp.]